MAATPSIEVNGEARDPVSGAINDCIDDAYARRFGGADISRL
jgi:hypothetical protein